MKTKRAASRQARIKSSRPVHKRLLLHPLSVFLILCTGVLLFGWTWHASADGPTDTASFSVHGRVPAPPLTDPAVITNVEAGHHYTSSPIEVIGTCPDDSYVKIFRNSIFAAVTDCVDGQFDPLVQLTLGENVLQAFDYNITDDQGPLSDPITVYLDTPPTPENPVSPNQPVLKPAKQETVALNPFVITSQYTYQGYLPGQTTSWTLDISGGNAPYGLTVSWGDKQESTYAQAAPGALTISHKYTSAGEYTVKITGADTAGHGAFLQLFSIVKSEKTFQFLGTTNNPLARASSSVQKWLWLMWPAYVVMLLMVLSFWLGERQELWLLSRSRKAGKNRRR